MSCCPPGDPHEEGVLDVGGGTGSPERRPRVRRHFAAPTAVAQTAPALRRPPSARLTPAGADQQWGAVLRRGTAPSTTAVSTGSRRFDGIDPADAHLANRVLLFGVCALLGSVVQAGWLGRDSPAGDVLEHTGTQVVGCLVSLGAVTTVLARWRDPLVAPSGTAFGCWTISSAVTAADPVGSGPL